MAANYATAAYCVEIAGKQVTILPGETRDTVTDSTVIATWASDWTSTAPTAVSVGPLMAGWLAAYPRGTVS